jgi:hypothetical protein
MLALNSPVSLETSLAALKANGRTEEMLKLLGEYEQLRLGAAMPASVREKLRTGEWHRDGERAIRPVHYGVKRMENAAEVSVPNEFGGQPFKFRLQAMPVLAQAGDSANKILFRSDPPMALSGTHLGQAMPGAPTGRIDLKGTTTNLIGHRALAVKLSVDGPASRPNEPHPVLNVQLEASNGTYRDYYIDLDFVGEQTIIIPEPTTDRMLSEFRPAAANYPFKAAMYSNFDYQRITAVNFRWMRYPGGRPSLCRVSSVEALAERGGVVKDLRLRIGDAEMRLPVSLGTGEYVEYWADGKVNVFDRNGRLLDTIQSVESPAMIQRGNNKVVLSADSAASVKLTTILLGDALKF